MFFLNITPGSPNKSCYCSVREGSETPTGGLTSLGSHSAPIHGLLRTLLSLTSSLPLVKKKKQGEGSANCELSSTCSCQEERAGARRNRGPEVFPELLGCEERFKVTANVFRHWIKVVKLNK